MTQYLDENGNPLPAPPTAGPQTAGVTYLDPNTGEPINAAPPSQPAWSLSSVLSGTDPLHQAIDEAAKTVPIDTSSVGGFAKSVANDLGAGAVRVFSPLTHPINTVEGMANAGAAVAGDPTAAAQLGTGAVAPILKNPGGEAVAAIPQVAMAAIGGSEAPNAASAISDAGTALAEKGGAVVDGARTAASKLVPSLIDGPPESLITRAIKPGKNNVNWTADVQKALPQMKSAEAELGHPVEGIDDALQAANIAKKNIWKQYQARVGAAGQAGATIDGNQIADAMVNNIDQRTATQNPQLVNRVKAVADTYRHPMTLDDAEDFLQSANKDLNSYYAKNKVGQQVAQNDPEISSTVAEADALRTALYGKLDQMTGPGAAQLKQSYGSLTNVEKELYSRQLVAARQNPESLSEQLSTVRGAGKIAKGVLTASPGDVIEGAQNIAVARMLKARNTSDAMIARAFQKVQPATPFPPSAAPQIAGLLGRGPIQMAAPEGAPSTPSAPPPFNYTTRALRQGKLLPAQTGGPIELPYVPEMSGGEQLAALMQYLRKKPQAALPASASAIPLSDGR